MAGDGFAAAEAALEKIEKTDGRINAVITVTRSRAQSAWEKTKKRLDAGEKLPLAGVPVIVKDNIFVDGEKLTCASHMLENFTAMYDAAAVTALERAGAVIVGKANMDEFAMGITGETSYFGATKNPLDTRFSPGGSSSGCGAALAAGYVDAALGSDTGGSARLPAAWCGVWALKPTYGAVSRRGLVAFASSMDQICPMAASGQMLAKLTDAVAVRDELDLTSTGLPSPCCGMKAELKGVKAAIPSELTEGMDSDTARCLGDAENALRELGAEVVRISLPTAKHVIAAYHCISSAEASSNLARFDGMRIGLRGEGRTFAEAVRDSRTRGFGSEVRDRILRGVCVLDAKQSGNTYLKAVRARGLLCREMEAALERYDFLLTPATPRCAPVLGAARDYRVDQCCAAASLAGLPCVAFPWGKDGNGLPIGMMLTGRAFDDGYLIAAARAMKGE